MSKKLSTDPYKGVRDFYPTDMATEKYIFDVWRKTVESFGYEEYGASVLEPADLYRAKSSDEIVNEQTYTFTDRGDREVTLRPEMTPTLARMVAARRRELTFPLRWYSIPNLFRYEQPQRGRVREHWQLNADLFGVSGIEGDIEVISLAYRIMRGFGARDGDFQIQINSRQLLHETYEPLLKDPSRFPAMLRLLDKKEKMGAEAFDRACEEFFKEPLREDPMRANERLTMIIERLQKMGISATFNPHMVRGFDYYTDIVFEIFDADPVNRRSLFGGGRYDNLTSLFGGDAISAVGFGMGDVTIRDFLETHQLLPTLPASADAMIIVIDEQNAQYSLELAQSLRDRGIRVAVDLSGKKIGDQIKNADKRGIPYVIPVGDEEARTSTLKLKKLSDGQEVSGSKEEIIGILTKK